MLFCIGYRPFCMANKHGCTGKAVKMASVVFTFEENKITAHIAGEIDHHAAAALRLEIDERIISATPKKLVFDMASVSFMDSSGVGLILGRKRLLESFGGVTVITAVKSAVQRMIILSGLQAMLEGQEEIKKEVNV